jgi:hypothetical protein
MSKTKEKNYLLLVLLVYMCISEESERERNSLLGSENGEQQISNS